MTEIKSCPFCGGKARVRRKQYRFLGQNEFGTKSIAYAVYVSCNKCFAKGEIVTYKNDTGTSLLAEEKAIELWNRRV